ncbi:hypothetical protein GJ744_012202 [Endocarpon pusillum]|uniref:Uncharacterized protein n=1 Tax=Endocarpon pusillum TaxID=364733 RepID=A0A8H7AC52_9EURO|nr:hypothetical protein GJ744_012202 [Endocarpon pusillum]
MANDFIYGACQPYTMPLTNALGKDPQRVPAQFPSTFDVKTKAHSPQNYFLLPLGGPWKHSSVMLVEHILRTNTAIETGTSDQRRVPTQPTTGQDINVPPRHSLPPSPPGPASNLVGVCQCPVSPKFFFPRPVQPTLGTELQIFKTDATKNEKFIHHIGHLVR